MKERSLFIRCRGLALAGALACFVAGPLGFAPVPASAQAQAAATLSGRVTDPSGKALKARVTATGSNASKTTETKADGTFNLTLPAGSYSVQVAAPGFQTTQTDNVIVPSQQPIVFALPAASLQTIGRAVTSTSPTALNTTAAAKTTISDQLFIDQGQTQVINVLDQTPGIEIIRSSGNSPGSNSSISIRGAQPYESQILIDGHPVTTSAGSAYGFNSTFLNSLILGSVEVFQGPGATNLNTVEDAIGGSVNFRTPTITQHFTSGVLTGYDSFNGSYFALKASDTSGKFGYLVAYAENQTPGYVARGTEYADSDDGSTYVNPGISPGTDAGQPHEAVINYSIPTSQAYASDSELVKLAYNFSPQTSLTLENFSTQTNNDETGTLAYYVYAKIVPCLPLPTCSNYTNPIFNSLIGTTQKVATGDAYANDSEFDNEPIYSADFRTVIGPGSFLARYYTGTIDRNISQTADKFAVASCASPACPPNGNSPSGNGSPYLEQTLDILHGTDAQYVVPIGVNTITLGFDRHVDNATETSGNLPLAGPFNPLIPVQSITYSLRGDFQLTPKLDFTTGNYFSSTSYVGQRFDPRDGLVYHPNQKLSVRGSYGTAFVAPFYSIVEPVAESVTGGVLTLPPTSGTFKPESSVGEDVGADYKPSRNTLISTDIYNTNIFNRFELLTYKLPEPITVDHQEVTSVDEETNLANVKEKGIQFSFLDAPQVGFGFHSALDLLRDYAYNQVAKGGGVTAASVTLVDGSPANYLQLPSYPYYKLRNDAFFTFRNHASLRFSSTSYGANNSFGQPGFTIFDAAARVPLRYGISMNLGASNLFNHNDYQTGAIDYGGYTYQEISGAIGGSDYRFVQPRTVFLQLQKKFGQAPEPSYPTSKF